MHYLISVAYDGSKFYGFQRLNNLPTVQAKIEEALSLLNKKEVTIKGAGRTDRGVHAYNQKATFSLDVNIEPSHLKEAINSLVKPYIYITDVKEVPKNFHARFNVSKKEYIYKINLGEFNPLLADYLYTSPAKLDIKKMQKGAKEFLGVHNFQNFVSGERKNYECIIYKIIFKKIGSTLEIKFEGKSFYRYMVRNLVGALLEIGLGKKDITDIKNALANPTVSMHFLTAPPEGLYLSKIYY